MVSLDLIVNQTRRRKAKFKTTVHSLQILKRAIINYVLDIKNWTLILAVRKKNKKVQSYCFYTFQIYEKGDNYISIIRKINRVLI